MNSVFLFVVVLGILIFFHELGHFLVARMFGVGVEKFSLGFGPRLFGRTVGRTDYRVSLVPLGGYVKMVGDEPDAPLAQEDLPYSFTHKHVAKRSLIVAAGPLFNILLAVLIFIGIFYFVGLPSIRPVVRNVEINSPAQQTGIQEGDLIRAINGNPVDSWRGIDAAIEQSQGKPVTVDIARSGEQRIFTVTPKKVNAENIYGESIAYYDLGIQGYEELEAVVRKAEPGMPAEKAGLQKGDRIQAIDGKQIQNWEAMHEAISSSKGATLTFTIQRGDRTFDVDITPAEVKVNDAMGVRKNAYRIGIFPPDPIREEDKVTIHLGLWGAFERGLDQTWLVIKETGRFFVKLAERKVPKEAIGGPIRIALMANQQAEEGILALLSFIAIISINLAVINLVPIPVLDGGHLLFFAIEAIQRKPVSIRMRETAQQVGVFLLILLMIFVFYNDISITWFR
ncbi:MAG: RIP metalloprotease RseP [Desulfobacteraceae bacterium]|nr:MAG: RIP metalloprotease RseP [Desulfobacteraceae bacterium]